MPPAKPLSTTLLSASSPRARFLGSGHAAIRSQRRIGICNPPFFLPRRCLYRVMALPILDGWWASTALLRSMTCPGVPFSLSVLPLVYWHEEMDGVLGMWEDMYKGGVPDLSF